MKICRHIWMLLLVPAALCSVWTTSSLYSHHKEHPSVYISRLIYLPESVLKAVSLEFSGVLSDYLMLETMVFHGERLLGERVVTREEWQATLLAVQQITNLDPRFLDPYVLAETSLPWDAGMVRETNELLLKAAKARPDDYRPNFFIWFNYVHFLKDPAGGVPYMEKAGRTPNAPVYFATLAARGNYFLNRTKNAILFLEEILKETTDPAREAWIEKRLQAMKAIAFLEDKIQLFRSRHGRQPANLQELIDIHLLREIPSDPYGGSFFMNKNGRVYTTSKLVPYHNQNQSSEQKKGDHNQGSSTPKHGK